MKFQDLSEALEGGERAVPGTQVRLPTQELRGLAPAARRIAGAHR